MGEVVQCKDSLTGCYRKCNGLPAPRPSGPPPPPYDSAMVHLRIVVRSGVLISVATIPAAADMTLRDDARAAAGLPFGRSRRARRGGDSSPEAF
jgi:hypothetical protein